MIVLGGDYDAKTEKLSLGSASRIAYMRDVIAFAKAHGIPWCVWNYLSTPNDGNRFSLVDDDTREFLSPELLEACLGQ